MGVVYRNGPGGIITRNPPRQDHRGGPGLSGIDWLDTPLDDFLPRPEKQEDGSADARRFPLGKGVAQDLVVGLWSNLQDAYVKLLSEEDYTRTETSGEVPIIRAGQRTYESLDRLTLRDLPTILDTLVVLEEEQKEYIAAERKARGMSRDRERRKRKKLGEW
jgi:hypothetical protein